MPLAGTWNAGGNTTVGVFRKGTFFLAPDNNPGSGTVNAFDIGLAGDIPITGDWTASGISREGVFRNGAFYLAQSNTNGGGVVTAFIYGTAGGYSGHRQMELTKTSSRSEEIYLPTIFWT
jgi:hypothetical protein